MTIVMTIVIILVLVIIMIGPRPSSRAVCTGLEHPAPHPQGSKQKRTPRAFMGGFKGDLGWYEGLLLRVVVHRLIG